MPLTTRLKRLVSSISNRPPPYDPDTDEFVGATVGKKYALDYDASRRTSRGSISFDETRRPSVEYRTVTRRGSVTSPSLVSGSATQQASPRSIGAALSDAGIGSMGGVNGGGGQGDEDNNEGGDEGTGMMRRGSAGVVGGNIVVKRGGMGMGMGMGMRGVRPDGLRCQICKELLTYASGHKLNPLDNGLFCNTCVSLKRHRDPSSFREYAMLSSSSPTPSRNNSSKRISRTSSLITRSSSKTSTNTTTTTNTQNGSSSTSSNGNTTTPANQLSKVKSNASSVNKPLSDTGPMPNPAVLFDLTVIRPFHLGGYFPVKCSRCGDKFEICHDRYAGARCTLCCSNANDKGGGGAGEGELFDICGTCLANPENGAYLQLLRHKEGKHPEVFCNREIAREVLKREKENGIGSGKDNKGGEKKEVEVNGVDGGMVATDEDMDGEGIDPLDTSNNPKGKMVECNGNGSAVETKKEETGEKEEMEEEEELPPVLEWILYQPPGRIFGPAWRVATARNSV